VLFICWYSRARLREAVKAFPAALCDLFRSRSALLAENTLLRQQVLLLHRATPHPRLKARDRFIVGHRGLHTQAPLGARWLPPVRPTPASAVRGVPVLGGLHHEYTVAA